VPDSQLAGDERIGHIGRLPIIRTRGLDHIPPQDDARVAGPGLGRSRRVDVGLNNAEACVRRLWHARLRERGT